jgi:hypothetical protein
MLTFERVREEVRCDAASSNSTSVFTRSAGMDPGFLTQYVFGPIARRRLGKIMEELCPQRLLDSVEAGLLPRNA